MRTVGWSCSWTAEGVFWWVWVGRGCRHASLRVQPFFVGCGPLSFVFSKSSSVSQSPQLSVSFTFLTDNGGRLATVFLRDVLYIKCPRHVLNISTTSICCASITYSSRGQLCASGLALKPCSMIKIASYGR